MASAPRSPIPALLIALGSMVFWVLVIIAAVEGSDLLVGIALALGAATAAVAISLAVRRGKERSAARTRILDQGNLARARILSAKNNGALNDDPYVDFVLEVQPEDAEPYRVDHRTLVSQMAIPRVQPGTEVDVYVDPTDPKSVVIDPEVTG